MWLKTKNSFINLDNIIKIEKHTNEEKGGAQYGLDFYVYDPDDSTAITVLLFEDEKSRNDCLYDIETGLRNGWNFIVVDCDEEW